MADIVATVVSHPPKELLKASIISIISNGDLDALTTKSIRKQLEQKHNCNLSSLKSFISESVTQYLATLDDDDDDDDDDDEEEKQQQVIKEKKRKRKKKKKKKKKTKKRGGFQILCQLDTNLAEFLGKVHMSRTQVVKELWAYIKSKNLQNPMDRRQILLDDALQKVFKRKRMTAFSMNKFLSPLIKRVDDLVDNPPSSSSSSSEEEESESESSSSSSDTIVRKKKKRKKSSSSSSNGGGGWTKQCTLSPELAAFMNSDKAARTEVVKEIWRYVKERELQKPSDRRIILCDDKLRTIMDGKDEIHMFTMNKVIQKHYLS